MAKRAGSELNHLNWDKVDDEKEEAGVFKPVSSAELQNRVIKQAKRRLTGEEKDKNMSPFSAFAGFTKPSKSPFTFGTQESQASKSSASSNAPDNEPRNGCEAPSVSKPTLEPSKETVSSTQPKSDGKGMEYFRQLQSLNESVLEWMQLHIKKNPCCDFTPVFQDYKSHLQKLERMYPVPKRAEIKPTFDPSRNPMFKMPKPAAATSSTDSSLPSKPEQSGFLQLGHKSSDLRKEKASDSDLFYGAHFASNTTNTSTFSFGIKESPTSMTTGSKSGPTSSHSSGKTSEGEEETEKKDTPTVSFTSKPNSDNSSVEPNSSAKFTFGLSAVSSSAGKDQNCNDGKPEEYVPPKNEFTAVSEEDAFYSIRCKLFFKKGNEYVDKGVGMLYLKPIEEKTQLLIRADTNLGNILLNIMLSESLPIERTGKNNVLIVCVPNPPIDPKEKEDTKKSIPLLIRVKTSDDADELYKQLSERKS